VLPPERGEVGQQGVRDGLATLSKGIDRAAEIDRVPQRDRRRDQGEAARAVLLQFGDAVAQAVEAVEAHGPGQGVAAFALVQLGRGLEAQLRLFQPVQGVERALDAADFAQGERQAVLPGVGAEALEHHGGADPAGAHRGCEPQHVVPVRHDQLLLRLAAVLWQGGNLKSVDHGRRRRRQTA